MPGVIGVGLATADLGVSRMWPCSAISGIPGAVVCGATPSSMYRRWCGVKSHEKTIWLCPVHAALAGCGRAMCRECGEAGGVVLVQLLRLSGPIRM